MPLPEMVAAAKEAKDAGMGEVTATMEVTDGGHTNGREPGGAELNSEPLSEPMLKAFDLVFGDPTLKPTDTTNQPGADGFDPKSGWGAHVEDAIIEAAIQMAAFRALAGQSRRRYYLMGCEDHGFYLLSSGPKGLEGKSTWMGTCMTCGAAEEAHLVREIEMPSFPVAPKVTAEELEAVKEMLEEVGEVGGGEFERVVDTRVSDVENEPELVVGGHGHTSGRDERESQNQEIGEEEE